MMFSREGWRLEMGQAENCVKMSTKFRKFSIKNTDRGFILYVAVTSQMEGGGSFCCFYVCIIITIAENIAIHNLPEKVDAN